MKIIVLAGLAESLLNFRGHLLSTMVKAGHEVIACAPEKPHKVIDGLKTIGVSYHSIELDRTGMNPLKDLRLCIHLRDMFLELKPDVFFGYTIKPVIYGSFAARLANIPNKYSMITGLGYAFSETTLRQRLVNILVRRLFRFSLSMNDKVFFQNPDDLSLFEQLGLIKGKNKGILINGSGVDLDFFAQSSPVLDRPVFLLIARLLKAKGICEYVNSAKVLKERYPQAKFLLLGPCDSNPSAVSEKQIIEWQTTGVIEYRGEASDVRPIIAEASVFVLPSYYREGIPRTILEAMAMGKPIITTDAPGCRETVKDGENGFLVPVKDSLALAAAMEKFILQPALIDVMGKRSREIAIMKFDVHKVNSVIMKEMGLCQTI